MQPDEKLHYIVGIGFAVLAIAIGIAASLPSPLLVLDPSLKTGLFLGGFAFAGITITVASPATKAARLARETAAIRRLPPPA